MELARPLADERDLSGRDLAGADLSRADLQGTVLRGANLRGAVLFEADLRGADLIGADLQDADLSGVRASAANLGRARLRGAQLFGADLEDATLTGADLGRADLRTAVLDRARLRDTALHDADLSRARIRHADLSGATLAGASFHGADLDGTVLAGADGYETSDFVDARIAGTDFTGAYMLRRFILDQNYLHQFRRRHAVAYALWWLTSDCGRSLARWSVCTAVLAAAFALVFTIVGVDYGSHETWLSPIYYSVVTLTTLGYGDVHPTSVGGQVAAMAEACLGYVMLGGLLSILASKMARRAS